MSKTIFLNRRLSVPLRLKLLDALVLPIIFYGSGSWPLLSARQFQSLASTITKWQRQITDAEFRARWRIPPLAVRLAKHRLLLLLYYNFIDVGQVVWDFVTAEATYCRSTWFDAVRQALTWLSTMIPDFPTLEWASEEILRWVHEASPQTPNQIRRAVSRFLTQEQTIHHVARMHRDIKMLCQEHGVQFDEPLDTSTQEQLVDFFPCPTCSKVFSTIQGLTAHRWKQHGHILDERRFVYNGVCEGCRKCFWTAQRLQQHLRYSKRKPAGCYWWVSQHLDPLVEPERVEMPAIHRGQHRLPRVEVYGPQPQIITTRWSRQHSREWTIWQTEWHQEGFPEDLSEELCDRVLTDISSATLAWSSEPTYDLTWTWCEIVEEYASDAERYPQALWGRTLMYDVIEQIEEIDHKLHIEEPYLELLYELPIAGLLDRLERLHRAVPPEPSPPVEPAPAHDHPRRLPLEPISSAYDNSEQLQAR